MQSRKIGKLLSRAFWEGQHYHIGLTCGLSSTKRRSRGSPSSRISVEKAERPKSRKKRRMQPLHQGKRNIKGRRRRTFLRSDALNCGDLGHFTRSCPKKDKGSSESKAAAAKEDGFDDDATMSAHVSREKRWGDMDL